MEKDHSNNRNMKWYNLKANKCPKCSSYLTGTTDATVLHCSDSACDFKIGIEKFSQLSTEYVNKYSRRDKFSDFSGWNKFQD